MAAKSIHGFIFLICCLELLLLLLRVQKLRPQLYEWRVGRVYFSFISRMPTTVQIISRTRQMMLTKICRGAAAERPRAAMESTKPPSCTPSCMRQEANEVGKQRGGRLADQDGVEIGEREASEAAATVDAEQQEHEEHLAGLDDS